MGIFTKSDSFSDDPVAKRVIGAFVLLALEVLVIAAFIPREFTEKQIAKEISMVSDIMGPSSANAMQQRAKLWFNEAFVQTGVYKATFDFFLPTEAQKRKSKGMEELGENSLFPYVEKTLISIWAGVLQSTLRMSHYLLWWPFLLLACIPAIIDAWFSRKIKQASFRHASAIRYRYAISTLTIVVAVFLFSVFFPIAVPPVLVPVGFVLIAISLSFIFANLQKKI